MDDDLKRTVTISQMKASLSDVGEDGWALLVMSNGPAFSIMIGGSWDAAIIIAACELAKMATIKAVLE